MRHWPASAIYGQAHAWTRGEEYKLYCLSSNLMADMFQQPPRLLLEGVDWKTTEAATQVSELAAMHKLDQSFAHLGHLIPSKKQLAQINSHHVVNVVQTISMNLITNPGPPTYRVESKIDQHLVHFHNVILNEKGLNGEKT